VTGLLDPDPGDEILRSVPVHALMGLGTVQRGPHTVMTMEMTDRVRGMAEGSVHGGILATFADVACSTSLFGAYDFPANVPVTTDMHVRYFRQPRSGPLRADARLVHQGRRILSAECSVVDGHDRVLARSTATYMIVPLS
jgi:uncharacterized protein (TIGR00369 family)